MKRRSYPVDWRITAIAIFYAVCETGHFGWSWHPHSDAEFICDGIVWVLLALSFCTSQAQECAK